MTTLKILGYIILFIPFVIVSIAKRIVDVLYTFIHDVTYECAKEITDRSEGRA